MLLRTVPCEDPQGGRPERVGGGLGNAHPAVSSLAGGNAGAPGFDYPPVAPTGPCRSESKNGPRRCLGEIDPPDRHLFHPVSFFLGPGKNFDVVCEPVDLRLPEQVPCRTTAKQLEPALGVTEVPDHEYLDDPVEHFSHATPPPGLFSDDVAQGERPRTDRDIESTVGKVRHQLPEFFHRG